MLKQSVFYLLFSIIVIVFARYINLVIVYIDMIFTYINLKLAPVFSNTGVGIIIREIVCLTILPIIIAGIPALIYRALKGKTMPYFYELTWLLWLIIVLSKILIH